MADPESSPELYDEAVDTFATLLDYNLRTKNSRVKKKVRPPVKESKQYIKFTFVEEKGKPSISFSHSSRPEVSLRIADVLIAFGNVLFDQTRYQDSVAVLKTYLEREPMDPTAPELQEKIVTVSERDRNFDQAEVEREILNENYKEGSAWYAHNQDNPEAVKLAETLTQKALYTAAYLPRASAEI